MYSPQAILVELESGRVLAEQDTQAKIYPASLTKIMTAIVALENTENVEETVVLPSDLFMDLYAQGASMAGLNQEKRFRNFSKFNE